MTSTPKSTKHVQENESPIPSPLAGTGPGGHKPSFKSTKLARRARSFKDDVLGKISQMRSPGGGPVLRSQSPKGGRCRKPDMINHTYVGNKSPAEELDDLLKQIKLALNYFRDVVSKKIWTMLPGNGTLVLDSIWHINLTIKSNVAADCSSSIMSATNRMYQSVARLIKLCDDALIDSKSSELDEKNVNEVVAHVEEAVESLIKLAQEKIMHQQTSYKTTPRSSYGNTSLDVTTHRNSLPDIPLTPREREILEQTSCVNPVRSSHSTESVLRDPSPPPKPPRPKDGILRTGQLHSVTPPPLPPKKKNLYKIAKTEECYSPENVPPVHFYRSSKSPDSSSLLSASLESLDSMSNISREEEELRAIMGPSAADDTFENHTTDIIAANGSQSWEESSLSSSLSNQLINPASLYDYHRLSNTDSGIMSAESYHSSCYSKRSSQQSTSSHCTQVTKHSCSSSMEMLKSESILESLNEETSVKAYSQKTSSSSSIISTLTTTQQDEVDFASGSNTPPALPQKTKKKLERQPSPYDNVPDSNMGELLVTCQRHQMHQSSSSSISSITTPAQECRPPPLPPKKKHMFQSVAYSVMAYMEMFGNCSHTSEQEYMMRHSVHMVQHQPWTQTCGPSLTTTQSCSFAHTLQNSSRSAIVAQTFPTPQKGPSPLPSPNHHPALTSTTNSIPPALPPKQRSRTSSSKSVSSPPLTPVKPEMQSLESPAKVLPDLLEHTKTIEEKERSEIQPCDVDLMEEVDVDKWLDLKKPEEDGPDIRGGAIDALIIQASKATKNGVFAYQEAFLTTYRTFITPYDLVCKLTRRYNHFYYMKDRKTKSREAFALIVRVVSDLTCLDLDNAMQLKLMKFVQHLITCGELTLAKALRVKHLERYEAKERNKKSATDVINVTMPLRSVTLLDFKSEQIAEQMTLLDAELFVKIEIPEVLIWAQEQNEERSPNLTLFTEHFNKMSFWARTRILQINNKELREKYFLKFIKIMKHLRKINNFNSYLALLSALDSAPVRRLEWQKHVQDGLKEYCALIDSSSSFRAYRQALAETQPPCIPYIGLILQDLTFVHIGNSNLLSNGHINFSKRWQQFNILENMKKFKKCSYPFKKNEKIISFFDNFSDFLQEDALWQLSETIKPRGKKATQ